MHVVQALLSRLVEEVADLSIPELIDTSELCVLVMEQDIAAAIEPSKQRALALRSEMYMRMRHIPLSQMPRMLASLHQLLSVEDVTPLLRRCAGRLITVLGGALSDEVLDRTKILDADTLGELLYIYAACNYNNDQTFLDTCRKWLLPLGTDSLAMVVRDVSLVHLLHSLAVLQAAHGEVLHALVAATLPRLPAFGFFELLGFMDAAALLQVQAGRADGMDADAPPPSGVGEAALRAMGLRAEELLPELGDDELRSSALILSTMRLPAGVASTVLEEASARGLNQEMAADGSAS